MNILLLANYLPDNIQSINRFAEILKTSFTQLGHQVRIIRPQPQMNFLPLFSNSLRKWLGYIDKYIFFPQVLKKELYWADIVHICDQSNAVYTRYLHNIPHVVTCNDLLAIRSALGEISNNQTGWTGKQLQKMILHGLNNAQRVICISKKTKQDLLRLSSLKSQTVSLTYMGLNYDYQPMSKQEAQHHLEALGIPVNSRFILHVGNNAWYKNRLGVLSIFNHLALQENYHLVMVGSSFTAEMYQAVKTYKLSHRIRELRAINNENLRALYSSATALLFPSLEEGFGWPIIEAQACGCPVFTSNRSPMTEIGGNTCIYINPEQPEEAASIIASYLPKLKFFKEKSLLNSQKFTTQNMIFEYLKTYQELVARSKC